MKVKERYSYLSEQRMFEWSLETPTMYNRNKRQHYAFFASVKECDLETLRLEEIMRLAKIADLQMKEFAPKRRR